MPRKPGPAARDHTRAPPVSQPRGGGPPQVPARNGRHPSVAFHVLMVDDDELSVRLVQRVLEVRGFSVESAASGMEALAAIDRRRPDVIIPDIMIPGVTRLEVPDPVDDAPRLPA